MGPKILWESQHPPKPIQIAALKAAFGEATQVILDDRPFSSAEQIQERYRQGGYDDMVVVAPLSVIARLVDLGITPMWSQMDQVGRSDACDLEYRGRRYRFVGFRRIKMVRLEFDNGWVAQRPEGNWGPPAVE